MIKFFRDHWDVFLFYFPLGVVGIWRWSVWILKQIIGLFYGIPRGKYPASLSIITPVYNEDPQTFRRALLSWAQNKPDEIIAVIDYSDRACIEEFRNFSRGFSGAKMIITTKQGKRPALADGVEVSSSEIVALVDSDTRWDFDIKEKILGPFEDPDVGGVVTRQDVIKTDTLARKLFKIHLDNRYLSEFPFLAAGGDALICLSGRTAVYRRKAIVGLMDALVSEKFMGKQMISGDDKTLTRLVQRDGWKTRYVKNAVVWTVGAKSLSAFIKQQVRWTRNGLRSDIKAIFQRWMWKHKVLAFHIIDKFVQPITLLVGPIYLIFSIFYGRWIIAGILFSWWMISRAIKIYPHLRERPMDVFLMPLYVSLTFMMAVVKVYSFFTIDKQGWLTRWDKSRMIGYRLRKEIPAYFLTASTVIFLFSIIWNYESTIFEDSRAKALQKSFEQRQKEEQKYIETAKIAIIEPSDEEISTARNQILNRIENDQFGYYEVQKGDILNWIAYKFNVADIFQITNADKSPVVNPSLIFPGQKLAIPISELREPIDAAIRTSLSDPIIVYDWFSNTIKVSGSGSIVNLPKINDQIKNSSILESLPNKEWALKANLNIGEGVTLIIDDLYVSHLKLKSDESGFVWIKSESGNILISKTKITSWDEALKTVDKNFADGRSYIVAKDSGRMDILDSDISYLGSLGVPTRGKPFGGPYGVSWKITNGSFKKELLTGVVARNKIHHNYFGLYVFGATGIAFNNNEVFSNVEYGIDPHDDSNNLLIENNKTYNNGKHGIITSKRCYNNIIRNNISSGNKYHGIMLHEDSNSNLVENNTVSGNMDGIAIYNSKDNLILDNELKDNFHGVRANNHSDRNLLLGNSIFSNRDGIYIYEFSLGNIIADNKVINNTRGIVFAKDLENKLRQNFLSGDNELNYHLVESQ